MQDIEKRVAEGFKTLVVKITDQNDNGAVIYWIIGERLAIAAKKTWELGKQDALAGISGSGKVFGNVSDPFVRMNLERMDMANDFGDKDIEHFLAGHVFSEDLEVYPITSRPDNHCTKVPPVASPRPPCF